MADTKTTGETTRSPIDGTELVRLATPGANWKATLANVFSALTLPGGLTTQVQYNDGGVFAGDAKLT